MIAQERWFLNSERSRAVRGGDPAAAFLLAAKGSEIPPQFVKLVEAAMNANTEANDEPARLTRVVNKLAKR